MKSGRAGFRVRKSGACSLPERFAFPEIPSRFQAGDKSARVFRGLLRCRAADDAEF
jgi:hypothetical protein